MLRFALYCKIYQYHMKVTEGLKCVEQPRLSLEKNKADGNRICACSMSRS